LENAKYVLRAYTQPNEPAKVSLCASGYFSGIGKPKSPASLKIP
jgi:hypothetical protein